MHRGPLGKLTEAARIAFEPEITATQLRGLGLTAADFGESPPHEIWPENHLAWRLFCDLSTQWRIGMAGATGLDYTPLMHLLNIECRDHDGQPDLPLWRDTFDALRVIEAAALDEMRTQAAEKQKP